MAVKKKKPAMIIQKPVPNFKKGRDSFRPEILVVHLGEGTAQQIYQTFLSEEKSSHYLICKNREVWQFVKEEDTAWGNGTKNKPIAKYVLERPEVNPNLYSISIENEGFTRDTIYESQYIDNADLVLELSDRWLIPLDREHILAHNEINAQKRCPLPISVDRILKLAQEKKAFQQKHPEEKIEELQKIKLSLLQRILAELQRQLNKLLGKV